MCILQYLLTMSSFVLDRATLDAEIEVRIKEQGDRPRGGKMRCSHQATKKSCDDGALHDPHWFCTSCRRKPKKSCNAPMSKCQSFFFRMNRKWVVPFIGHPLKECHICSKAEEHQLIAWEPSCTYDGECTSVLAFSIM